MSDDLIKRLNSVERDLNNGFPVTCERLVVLQEAAGRIEALEAQLAKADALAEAVTQEREMVCQDFGMQMDAATAVNNALTEYRAAREKTDG